MKLVKKLEEWVNNQLISPSQQQDIISYEANKNETNNLIQYVFMGLAGLTVGVGIISLIAYNWELLGKYMKLAGGMAVLSAFAWGYYHFKQKQSNAWSEVFLFLFGLGCMGYIGLVGQVYNLYSMPHRGFLFWSIITIPLLLTCKRAFFPFVWFSIFITTFIWEVTENDHIAYAIGYFLQGASDTVIGIFFLLVQYIFWQGGKRLFKNHPPLLSAFTVNIALSFIPLIFSLGLDTYVSMYKNVTSNYIFLLTTFVLIVGSWLITQKSERVFLHTSLVFIYIFMMLNIGFKLPYEINALFSILMLSMAAIYGAITDRNGVFYTFITIVVIRVIVFYVFTFDSLLATGIWLIASGVVTLVVVKTWFKYRDYLEARLKELL